MPPSRNVFQIPAKENIEEEVLKAIMTCDTKQFRSLLFQLSNLEIASLRLMEE